LRLALYSSPATATTEKVRTEIAGLPGVEDVHHLHVWAISTTETALTAHVVKSGPDLDDALLATIREELEEHFAITHVTIQLEEAGAVACGHAEPAS